eukprot:jgi/Orpsp1_1/1183831/evm.model.c7180000086882.1
MVKGLNSYARRNFESTSRWKLNKEKFEQLESGKNYVEENKNLYSDKNEINNDNSNSINLIIDGNAYLYFLGEQVDWFIYDTLSFLNRLRK